MDIPLLANILALFFSFFVLGTMLGALFSKPLRKKIITVLEKGFPPLALLRKSSQNPILLPGTTPWTAEAVLNPAAAVLGGRTHLVYRAIGMDGVSRLGYASSPNGLVFDDRLPYPIYIARNLRSLTPHIHHRQYSPVMYPSGGSWGGYEDPRMVVIDGRVYITFNMFENWVLRVAYISMPEEDFIAKRFYKWEGPFILSHGARDKNWVLFPEKIHGKFAVLHSIIGETDDRVRIEYTDDLKTLSQRRFESPDPQKIPDRQISWHVHVRSAGPPPIRTDRGWLVFYHANDAEGNKYKLGAMLLDLTDPTKILYRASAPVLTPDELYENRGKPGIVYACGATVQHGKLYIYYGGADKVICVATVGLNTLLDALEQGVQPQLHVLSAQAATPV
jgi:predicted GH43/DUF377 family glycosyl hydrolase